MEPLPVHRSVKVEAMQLRLLQLRHASKCLIEKNCPVSKTCAIMKELWRHILICRHNDCKRNHCLSSRQVLSHYSKCNFFGCLICVPVREAIYLQNQKNLERMATTSQSNLDISIQSKDLQSGIIVPLNEVDSKINSPSKGDQDHSPPRKVPRIEQRRDDAISFNFDLSEPRTTLLTPDDSLPTSTQQQQINQSQNQSTKHLSNGSKEFVPPFTSPAHPISSSVSPQVPLASIYPLDPISCGLYSFTDDEIKEHVSKIEESFRLNSAKIKHIFQNVIQAVLACSQGISRVDESSTNLGDDHVTYVMLSQRTCVRML